MNTALHESIKFFESGNQKARVRENGELVGRDRRARQLQRTARRFVPTIKSGSKAKNSCVPAFETQSLTSLLRCYLLVSRFLIQSCWLPDFRICSLWIFLVAHSVHRLSSD